MLKKTAVLGLAFLFVMTAFTGCLSSDDEETQKEKFIIAYEVKEDYENPDENPQVMADYLAKELDMDVELYPITSEGAIIEALRFGNADIAFMDGGAAWVGWKQYGLATMAADQKCLSPVKRSSIKSLRAPALQSTSKAFLFSLEYFTSS